MMETMSQPRRSSVDHNRFSGFPSLLNPISQTLWNNTRNEPHFLALCVLPPGPHTLLALTRMRDPNDR